MCSACDSACDAICKCPCCKCPEDRPSPLYLGYTLLANVPIAIIGIALALANASDWSECSAPFVNLNLYLLIMAAFALFFIGFATHLYRLFSRPYDPHGDELHKRDFSARACHAACHDVPVFFYFFLAPAAFVWACIGFSVQSRARDDEDVDGSNCPSSVITGTWIVALVMLIYLLGTIVVGLMSCCLEGQRTTRTTLAENKNSGPNRLMAHLMRPEFGGSTPAGAPPRRTAHAARPGPPSCAEPPCASAHGVVVSPLLGAGLHGSLAVCVCRRSQVYCWG